MPNPLTRIVCFFKGHRRGRQTGETPTHRLFQCPRCGRETRYKKAVASLPPVAP